MSKQIKINKYYILIFLFGISFISSLIISLTPTSIICDPGKGCDVVQNSHYAYTFGIKNSHYGVAIFTFLIGLTWLQIKNPALIKKRIINLGIITGSLISLWFIYLQAFVLNAWCKYCLVSDISLILALALIIIWRDKK